MHSTVSKTPYSKGVMGAGLVPKVPLPDDSKVTVVTEPKLPLWKTYWKELALVVLFGAIGVAILSFERRAALAEPARLDACAQFYGEAKRVCVQGENTD